mmetsp:Transcript_50190/g.92720  ORF Transcript_50190/g.92720 Transcript_50190/m.92720 type:complete len:399 (-) Transcript_50190:116-1312(-)
MYSLILYGATGFTGQLAAEYVARQYASAPWKWAIAGRSREKLEQLKERVGADCGLLVADSQDEAAVAEMVKQTKVVVSFAGPFHVYGSKLVAACAAAGTDYCDITGEIGWVRDMIALHHDQARESGARIVHLCGHDSVPWDLMTMKLAHKLKEMGASELDRVDMWDSIWSKPSGGTIETAMKVLFDKPPDKLPEVERLGYDPLLKPRRGTEKSPYGVRAENVNAIDLQGQPRTFFFMAGVNANTVKRSNALCGYGTKVLYREGQESQTTIGAIGKMMGLAFLGLAFVTPPVRALLRRYVLPAPGEGPSQEEMAQGYLVVTGVGKSPDGKVVKAQMGFPVDPGYKDTARMAVESGLALALDGDKLVNAEGGVLTPASCQGDVLLQRLVATGTTFEFLDP